MNLTNHWNVSVFFKKIILNSLKWPLVYLYISVLAFGIPLLLNYYHISFWPSAAVFNKIADIFLVFSGLSFCYFLFLNTSHYFEDTLAETNKTVALILKKIREGSKLIVSLLALTMVLSTAAPFHIVTLYLNNIIVISIIISISWILIQILYTLEAVLYQRMKDLALKDRTQIYSFYTKIHIFRNIGVVVISILTVAAILMTFASVRNIGISLLASAGVVTAIIGFSGQRALGSLFAGLQIAISQPIRIGDILLLDEEWGVVEEITFTYVYLKMRDKRRMVVPIGHFLEKKFENWTREGNSLTINIQFNVDYRMPIEPLRNELSNILKESKLWDGSVNKLMVDKLNDDSIGIRVQISTIIAESLFDFQAQVREKLLQFMRDNYSAYLPNPKNIDLTQPESP